LSIYRQILIKNWGHSNFRPLQEEIIVSIADQKKDTLGLLPTGGGKSIIFQVPALAMDGLCLVITPLIALMKDQVDNLTSKNIKAAAIYSGLSYQEIDIILNNCVFGAYKFLYLSPENVLWNFHRGLHHLLQILYKSYPKGLVVRLLNQDFPFLNKQF